MGSTPKCHKLRKDVNAGEAADRISNLSDSILCHMLSFLPTKDAFRTSVLSTRWKYLFASTPNLDFDYSPPTLFPGNGGRNSWGRQSFVNFVYSVLVLRKALHINRFRLKYSLRHESDDTHHVYAWIRAALWHNVRELDLNIPTSDFGGLPHDLFTCQTLVVLKLDGACELHVPSKACFPSLKMLHLTKLSFVDDESARRFFSSGCPVLEDLYIHDYCLRRILVVNISRTTLKSLTIKCFSFVGYESDYEIVVDAPCLEYVDLEFDAYVNKGYTLKNLNSLVEARINFVMSYSLVDSPTSLYNDQHVANLFGGISNVQFLRLSGSSMEALHVTECHLPTFPNLTHLELLCGPDDDDRVRGLETLLCLLESSPKLEVLVFDEGGLDHMVDSVSEIEYYFPKHLPICFPLLLQEIEILAFNGDEYELKLVEYILKNAEVLKKMTITTYMSLERKFSISQKLLTFPRCSKTCQIVLT